MLRVRFAPSPTGFLHIGSARTFLFNWLYARRNNGTMGLRIDNTDVDPHTHASVDSIFEGFRVPSAFAVFACIGRERAIERLRKV